MTWRHSRNMRACSVFTKGTVLFEYTKVIESSFHFPYMLLTINFGWGYSFACLCMSHMVFNMDAWMDNLNFKKKMMSRNWIKMWKLFFSDLSSKGQTSPPLLCLPSPFITFTALTCPPSPLSIKYTVNHQIPSLPLPLLPSIYLLFSSFYLCIFAAQLAQIKRFVHNFSFKMLFFLHRFENFSFIELQYVLTLILCGVKLDQPKPFSAEMNIKDLRCVIECGFAALRNAKPAVLKW